MDDLTLFGYPGLFIAAFLAGTPFPMNSEVVLSGLLVLGWSPIWCVLVAVAGNWCGAIVNYFLGSLCSYDKMLKWTRVNPKKLDKMRLFLTGRGLWFALGSGLPIIGNVIIISYGVLRAPFSKVAGIMLVGQFIRFSIWAVATLGLYSLFC